MTPDTLELKLADECREVIPKQQRKFFWPEFQVIPDTGNFVGLACAACENWFDFAHEKGCPAPKISKTARQRYQAFMRKCKEAQK